MRAVTVWTALDKTTRENGCLQISPGTHKLGKIAFGSTTSNDPTLSPEHEAELTAGKIYLPMEKGETVLLDNLMLHRSDANKTGEPRRGFSVWYTTAQPQLAKVFPDYVPRPDKRAGARL
jgi:ectoine hydroxylase-related dioxygenase (phytanoyl-CoA dioxygenase family)